jgi:hypothetical protein
MPTGSSSDINNQITLFVAFLWKNSVAVQQAPCWSSHKSVEEFHNMIADQKSEG